MDELCHQYNSRAGKHATNSGGFLQRIKQLGQGVCPGFAGSDALLREPIIGGQLFEQLDDPLEKEYRLGAARTARGKAARFQGAVASPVGRPLMLEDREKRRHKIHFMPAIPPKSAHLYLDCRSSTSS